MCLPLETKAMIHTGRPRLHINVGICWFIQLITWHLLCIATMTGLDPKGMWAREGHGKMWLTQSGKPLIDSGKTLKDTYHVWGGETCLCVAGWRETEPNWLCYLLVRLKLPLFCCCSLSFVMLCISWSCCRQSRFSYSFCLEGCPSFISSHGQ